MAGGIRSFEDIIAWQKARVLTRELYVVTRKPDFARDFGLASQLQRAGVSVMANIAEGFERRSTNDFDRFLVIAKASCAEVLSHLYIALDVGYLTDEEFSKLQDMARETGRVLSGFRSSIQPRKSTTRNSELGTRN